VIVLVGSTRPAKVEGVREALQAIARVDGRFSDADLRPSDLTAIAPRMPMTTAAIVAGARTRAQALLEHDRSSPPRFAVGLEGGLDRVASVDGWMLQSWAVVTDGERWSYGAGPSLAIPTAVAERVVAGEELGDVIDRLAGASVRGTHGAWGVLTKDLIGRRDAFRLAAIAAFAPFYGR
jgi:inosine/xanthosine triphosphatase